MIDQETAEALRDLLEDHSIVSASLADVIEFGNLTERSRALRAVRVNGRTVAHVARYLVEGSPHSWYLHRESLGFGGEEWTVHT